MKRRIGIRLEDKNAWERRAPLIPAHVRELIEKHDIDVCTQTSMIRAFADDDYAKSGALVVDNLRDCPIIFAVKEIPVELLESGKTYIFFSHTIKGQDNNMPMLQRILDLESQLIDYEKITDSEGRRLVFFGNYAGLAGMIDTLWALGQRLRWEGVASPFGALRQTLNYPNLDNAKEAIRQAGAQIRQEGLPAALCPLICGFAGYGNVSRGAQEIFDLLPVREIQPDDLMSLVDSDRFHVYKVVFKEQHMVEPITANHEFQLQDYYKHPNHYRPKFETYVPFLTVLVNGIYWTDRYPRLVTRNFLRQLFSKASPPRLRVIGDISCDTEGAIECNLKSTDPGNPVYVYDPHTESTRYGCQGPGVVVLAVDNLPCELPRESSTHFSRTLLPFVPEIAVADYSLPLKSSGLSPTLQRAVITWQGELTPDFIYLAANL